MVGGKPGAFFHLAQGRSQSLPRDDPIRDIRPSDTVKPKAAVQEYFPAALDAGPGISTRQDTILEFETHLIRHRQPKERRGRRTIKPVRAPRGEMQHRPYPRLAGEIRPHPGHMLPPRNEDLIVHPGQVAAPLPFPTLVPRATELTFSAAEEMLVRLSPEAAFDPPASSIASSAGGSAPPARRPCGTSDGTGTAGRAGGRAHLFHVHELCHPGES